MWQIDKNVNHPRGTRDRIRETTARKIRSRRFRKIGLARIYDAPGALSPLFHHTLNFPRPAAIRMCMEIASDVPSTSRPEDGEDKGWR